MTQEVEKETVGDWAGHTTPNTHNPEQDWTEAWEPQFSEGEMPTIAAIVAQAIGAGSMCWTSTPNGVFKSEQANWITGGAVNAIERLNYWKYEVPADAGKTVYECPQHDFCDGGCGIVYDAKKEGPQAPSRQDQEIDDLRSELDRFNDKLFLIERFVEGQAPFGTDLANFRRRLLLLVRA